MATKPDPARTLARLAELDAFDDETFAGVTEAKLDLRGKRFSNCTFEAMNLPDARLDQCVFADCRFVRCDLSMSKLSECSLREVSFEHTKLLGIDWSTARVLVFEVSFHTCVLSYGSFFKRRLRETKLIDCVAHEVDFSAADLTAADFTGTDLRDA